MPDHEPADQPELLPGFRDLDVTPLPAAEIRARGDRLRRRRTTLTVLGAAASVAVVAGVIGAVNSPAQQVLPAPAPATTSPSAEPVAVAVIPADFPLRAGWPEGSKSSTPTLATVQDRDPCGNLSTSTPGREEAVQLAEYLGPLDDVHVRVLTVYASDYDASQALMQHRADRLTRCPGLDNARSMPAKGPLTSAGVSSETTVSRPSEGAGLALFRGVRVGSAVLYTMDSTLDPVDPGDYAEETAGTLAPVLEAMLVFDSPPGVSDIPADFPLDLDQVAMTGDGGEMRGPSPDETGLGELELCDTSPWLDTPSDRLASTATGPEYADVRELRVYGSADDAVVQMERLRSLLDDCADEPVESGGRLVHAPIDAITGYDSVTWGDYYTEGLGGGPVQFTRIGRAVLAVSVAGEYGEASLEGSDEQVTEVTLAIASAMCDFTEAGC